jgi:hypothetical protein
MTTTTSVTAAATYQPVSRRENLVNMLGWWS